MNWSSGEAGPATNREGVGEVPVVRTKDNVGFWPTKYGTHLVGDRIVLWASGTPSLRHRWRHLWDL